MNFIWDYKECCVRDVFSELNKQRKIAYTTVATIIQRLENKGFVTKREQGKTNFYKAKQCKKEYTKRLADSFIKKFVGSFGDVAVASFAEGLEDLTDNRREYLLRLLQKNEKFK